MSYYGWTIPKICLLHTTWLPLNFHLNSTWLPLEYHLNTTWLALDYHLTTTWHLLIREMSYYGWTIPKICLLHTNWLPLNFHLNDTWLLTWLPLDYHLNINWLPLDISLGPLIDYHLTSTWMPYDHHLNTTLLPMDYHLKTTCLPLDFHLNDLWTIKFLPYREAGGSSCGIGIWVVTGVLSTLMICEQSNLCHLGRQVDLLVALAFKWFSAI